MKLPLSLLLAALLTGCITPPSAPDFSPDEARLVEAMAQRLALAREVAWNKYRDGRPVRDPAREAQVLDASAAAAASRGLDAAATRSFFAAQIAASCAQQERFIYLWKRGAPLPTYAPRSPAAVRLDIDAVNREILAALARLSSFSRSLRSEADRSLRQRGIFPKAARLATAPLARGATPVASSRSGLPTGNTSPGSPSVRAENTALP